MKEQVLLGDEAVAMAAVDAGVTAAYAYPGTPSTEIVEFLIKNKGKFEGLVAQWTANEKTAMEEALGTAPEAYLGLVLPPDFDQAVSNKSVPEVEAYAVHWAAEAEVEELRAFAERALSEVAGQPVRLRVVRPVRGSWRP